jgi:hypothetical protein
MSRTGKIACGVKFDPTAAASPFVMLGVKMPRRDSWNSRGLILP